MIRKQLLRKLGHAAGMGMFVAATVGVAQADTLNIASEPLFLGTQPPPNIMFVLDDSSSMEWETMPEDDMTFRFASSSGGLTADAVYFTFPLAAGMRSRDVYGASFAYDWWDRQGSWNWWGDMTARRTLPAFDANDGVGALYRSQHNTLYYNPRITYRPWVNENGEPYISANDGHANPAAAYYNPANPSAGTFNLVAVHTVDDVRIPRANGTFRSERSYTFYPATYFYWKADNNANRLDPSNYTRTEIKDPATFEEGKAVYTGEGREERTDCEDAAAGICTYQEEIQNFANWYQYYRSRLLASRAGIGHAFAQLDDDMRVGFGRINRSSSVSLEEWNSPGTILSDVLPFGNETARAQFFQNLYQEFDGGQTPLRRALAHAGQYFTDQNNDWPWRLDLEAANPQGQPIAWCINSATVLMSDGYWTEGDAYAITGDGNRGLGQIAARYWNNTEPTPTNENSWRKMRTFTVGLGVQGTIDPDNMGNRDPVTNWPNPFSGDAEKIDDMLAAAIRGNEPGAGVRRFFSADEPDRFADELLSMLRSFQQESSRASASMSASTTYLEQGTFVYQAGMVSGDWTGSLNAYEFANGQLVLAWDAGEKLTPQTAAARKIVTINNGEGEDFAASNAETLDLDTNLIRYIRGEELVAPEGEWRQRVRLLGDIVNSSPAYAGGENAGWLDFRWDYLPASDKNKPNYRDWIATTNSARRPALYVGANDGMLHAFDAETGDELFGFIPGAVLPKLERLADPEYVHEYFVDGSPIVMDAYVNNAWKTILVGSAGAGARSVFALDVTNPSSFAKSSVLWELTEANNDNLGYVLGEPSIARLANGKWVAVFGNGYNSANGSAALFLVELDNGTAHVITLESGANGANGLAAPALVDLNGDRVTDRIYAGDLQGNLWRVDIGANDALDDLSGERVFTAVDAQGRRQPITTRPDVSGHPDPGAVMVYFGTGKYFEENDGNTTDTQTFYGILDKPDTSPTRADLFAWSFEQEQETFGAGEHAVTRTIRRMVPGNNNGELEDFDGWYIDLTAGERVIAAPEIIADRVRFLTFKPSDNVCALGGENWLMEVNARTGGRVGYNIWDMAGTGVFDFGDGGTRLDDGAPPRLYRSLYVEGGPDQLFTTSVENPLGVDDSSLGPGSGRQSWREL